MIDYSLTIRDNGDTWKVAYRIDGGMMCFQEWNKRDMPNVATLVAKALRDWPEIIEAETN